MSAAIKIGSTAQDVRADSGFRGRDLLRRVPAMLHVLRTDGTIEAISDVWLEQLGYRADEVIGRPIGEFLAEDSRAAITEEKLESVFKIGHIRSVRRRFRKKDGDILPVELSANAYRGARNNLNCMIAVMGRIAAGGASNNSCAQSASTTLCGEFVGRSAGLQRVCEKIDKVAATSASVFISGESGVGKELVARAIHEKSTRFDRPMIKINCAAIPADLFESEFFGHAKGSFTSASRDRAGRFELADGGTLLLDEIAEIPVELQSKLLRVLEEGAFERIGEDRTRRVDVRVIAASNRDLSQAVMDGQLRADLFYRLHVFPIVVPPLRNRPEDIVPLAEYFLRQASQEFGTDALTLSQADAAFLHAHDWPGNVRELRNVIEYAVINSQDGTLRLTAALPSVCHGKTSITSQTDRVASDIEWRGRYRANVLSALETTNWKIEGPGGAAALLELKPSTLRSRIKTLGITRPGRPAK